MEHVPWQEIFGVEEDDGTALESVKLKRVGVVGLQDSRLGAELVECFAAKPSVVNVGIHHGATGGASSKFDIMPVCFSSLAACVVMLSLFHRLNLTSLRDTHHANTQHSIVCDLQC